MKHAGREAIVLLGVLCSKIRERDALVEKKPGIFYLKSRAFLHFHEDPKGLFADVKLAEDFLRYPVNTPKQQMELLARIDRFLTKH